MSAKPKDEFVEAFDLETWFQSEGIVYKESRGRSGPQLNVRECPDCGNREFKVFLNADNGLGNCFTCPRGFNKLTFVHAYMGKPHWREVFEFVKKETHDQGWRPKRMKTASVEVEKATLPISFPLPTPEGQNLAYLETRGVTGAIAGYFHLRYCDQGVWQYTGDYGVSFQNFASRVIIPIYDLDGEFVTFQGRDITGVAEKKYLFPIALPGTGRYLYNGQNALGAKRACMGEGVFDVIALKLAFDEVFDLRDVVPIGSFGKNLSAGYDDDQLTRLRRLRVAGLQELTICWDGEEKALVAALDTAKKVIPTGIKVRIMLLPPGKDPNEVSSQVVCDAFRKAQTYTTMLDLRLRMQNPFATRRV